MSTSNLSAAKRARAWQQKFAAQIAIKNASHPANQHWDIGTQSYQDNPVEAGKHWDYDLYKMVPD